jgi:uncharacterized protein (TIGR03437 family)
MVSRSIEAPSFARHLANSFAALLVLIEFVPGLLAQQYCVSGAVTSVLSCNGCNFKVGDPVAMTFTVVPSSITMIASNYYADAAFRADIGGRHWTTSQNTIGGSVGVILSMTPGPSTSFSLAGSGTLSPLPTPPPQDYSLGATLLLTVPGMNLLANGMLPAVLPSPDAIAASKGISNFTAVAQSATAYVSYTGQNCAATGSSPGAPTINAGGVAPLYSSSNTIQPGSWVSIFGTNLAASTATWNSDFPTSLGGTSVTINSKPAYLWYVSAGQINLQAPDDTALGSVNVVVTTAGGNAQATITLGQFGPSFSLLSGEHVAALILRSDGSGAYGGGTYDIVGPTGTSLGYKTVAAKAGDSLELFGVGFGPTSPPVPAGKVFAGAAATTNPVRLSIKNVTVTPTFAGVTSAGLYQINITLPAGLGTGDVPLQAVVGGALTPSGVVLSVQ